MRHLTLSPKIGAFLGADYALSPESGPIAFVREFTGSVPEGMEILATKERNGQTIHVASVGYLATPPKRFRRVR